MGAINYKTSKYITMVIKEYDIFDMINEADFLECVAENGGDITDDTAVESFAYETITSYYDADYENAKSILNKYDFMFFDVSIESGYYEGLQIVIDDKYCYLYDYMEKQEAQKEITQLKKCLIELAGVGFVACVPFWIMSYSNYNETLQKINDAVLEMRETYKHYKTANTYDFKFA